MALFATQPVSNLANPLRNRPVGFKMDRPNSRWLKSNGQLQNRLCGWL